MVLKSIYRPVFAEVNHRNLIHNFRSLSRLVGPGVSLLAVVKANGYGHGLPAIAKTLSRQKVRFLGVTSVEEALTLKKEKISAPALILGNLFPFTNMIPVIENNVRATIASVEAARICNEYGRKLGKKVNAHAKIDTGMGRIGVNVGQGLAFVQKILSFPFLRLEGLYTHFSDSADDPEFTRQQLGEFSNLVKEIGKSKIRIPYIHCANSAGLLKYPDARFNLVRPGISLYGVKAVSNVPIELKPVLSWKSRIVFLKHVPPGTPISYARTFVTKRRSKIATAAFGYADGFRRSLSNNSWVLVRGQRVPVIGRITMDMTMLDVTDLPEVEVGDEVVLLGTQGKQAISIEEIAQWAQTSPYEMFCGVSTRVPRVNIY